MQRLSEDVKSLIRTGVALSSVAQVVEELVLNSVDAGTSNIAVRIDLSCFRVQVIDNGHGITEEQFALIGERYATSKCHSIKDLENLAHCGYRGEALASIKNASSFLEIISRPKGSVVTFSKCFQRGRLSFMSKATNPRPSVGTTITVHDLFYNLPVRRSNLSAAIEIDRLKHRIGSLALMWPKISISFRDDSLGHVILQTKKRSCTSGVFLDLFTSVKPRDLMELNAQKDHFSLWGFVSKESHNQKDLQFVYINKRLVLKSWIHKEMNKILGRSSILRRKEMDPEKYDGLPVIGLNKGSPSKQMDSYGIFVLNVTCPLREYEITFDPRKTLVEFRNAQKLKALIQDMMYSFLREKQLLVIDNPLYEKLDLKRKHKEDDMIDTKANESNYNDDMMERVHSKYTYGKNLSANDVPDLMMSKLVRRNIECDIRSHEESLDEVTITGVSESQTSNVESASSGEATTPETTQSGDLMNEEKRNHSEVFRKDETVGNPNLISLQDEGSSTSSNSFFKNQWNETVHKISSSTSLCTIKSLNDSEEPIRYLRSQHKCEEENPIKSAQHKDEELPLITLDESVEYSSSLKCLREINPFKVKNPTPDVSEISVNTLDELKKATRAFIDVDEVLKTPEKAVQSAVCYDSPPENGTQNMSQCSSFSLHGDICMSSREKIKKPLEISSESDIGDNVVINPPETSSKEKYNVKATAHAAASHRHQHSVNERRISSNRSEQKSNVSRSFKLSDKMSIWEKMPKRRANKDRREAIYDTSTGHHRLSNFQWSKATKDTKGKLGASGASACGIKKINDELKMQNVLSSSECPDVPQSESIEQLNRIETEVVDSFIHNDDIPKTQQNHTKQFELSEVNDNSSHNAAMFEQTTSLQDVNQQDGFTCEGTKLSKSTSAAHKKDDNYCQNSKNSFENANGTDHLSTKSSAPDPHSPSHCEGKQDASCSLNKCPQISVSSDDGIQDGQTLTNLSNKCFPTELEKGLDTANTIRPQISLSSEPIKESHLDTNINATNENTQEEGNILNSGSQKSTSLNVSMVTINQDEIVSRESIRHKRKLTCDTEVSPFFSLQLKTKVIVVGDVSEEYNNGISVDDKDGKDKQLHVKNNYLSAQSDRNNGEQTSMPSSDLHTEKMTSPIEVIPEHACREVSIETIISVLPSPSGPNKQSFTPTNVDTNPLLNVQNYDEILPENVDKTIASSGESPALEYRSDPISQNPNSPCLTNLNSDDENRIKNQIIPLTTTTTTTTIKSNEWKGKSNMDSVELSSVMSQSTLMQETSTKDDRILESHGESKSDVDVMEVTPENRVQEYGRKRQHSVDELSDVDPGKVTKQTTEQDKNFEDETTEVQCDKGLSLIDGGDNTHVPSADSKKDKKEDTEVCSKWREGTYTPSDTTIEISLTSIMERWRNPVFRNHKSPSMQTEVCPGGNTEKNCFNFINGLEFNNQMVENTKVIGQVDNKFIACIMDRATSSKNSRMEQTLLVLFDQHAVHERIRLESLTAEANEVYEDNSSKRLKSGVVKPPIALSIGRDDVRVMKAFHLEFERIGVQFKLDESVRDCMKLMVHSLPFCMTQRDVDEKERGMEYMTRIAKELIQRFIQHLKDSNGSCGRLPMCVHKVLCSQACRGAIKFGDPLGSGRCKQLLTQLSACHLPFQCAHGRPSIVPLINLEGLNREPERQRTKPKLDKISHWKHSS